MKEKAEFSHPVLLELKNTLSFLKTINKSTGKRLSKKEVEEINDRITRTLRYFRELIYDPHTKVMEKFEILMDGIALLRNILNYHPYSFDNKNKPEITFVRIYSVFLLFLAQITKYYGKRQELQLVAIAEVLGNILSGLEVINPINFLEDNENGLNESNALTIAFGQFYLYSRILEVIYDLSKNDFFDWTKKSLLSSYYLLILTNKILEKSFLCDQIKHDNPEFLFPELIDVVKIPFLLAQFFIEIAGYIYQRWPEELFNNPYGIDSYSDFKKTMTTIFDFGKEMYEKIRTISDSTKTPCKEIIEWSKQVLSKVLFEVQVNNVILNGVFLINSMLEGKEIEENDIKEIVNNVFTILNKKQEDFGKHDYLDSEQGELDYPIIRWFSQIIGFFSVINDNIDYILVFEKLIKPFTDWKGVEKFPDIKAILNLSKLIISVEHKRTDEIDVLSDELLIISNYYPYKIRDSLSFRHLGLLSKVVLDIIDPEILKFNLERYEPKLVEVRYYELLEEYREYISSLIRAFKNEETHYPSLWRIENINPFDAFSLLIPDFSKIVSEKKYGQIFYLPFNLKIDKIH